uniref:UPF0761 membrane protein Cag_0935 n=1 Tax=Chlorobium chlorochromatii (strain CaD3) TaxID=340177 RepID=Y935_CHLCH|nr:RecName: Full=UPF0761 membrane protein Cag_0935 [Chlorobium chlorochromatii CaD3]
MLMKKVPHIIHRANQSGGKRYERMVAFVAFFRTNLLHDRIFISAGSLAFQTLLSIVPVLAVVLSVLNLFEVFTPFQHSLETFLVENFMPATGRLLHGYLLEFVGKTGNIPLLGSLLLFVIALSLLSTVDQTLNDIWGIRAPRKALQGFTLYWTVLTLGPLLIVSSLAASSYVWYTIFTDEGALFELKTRLLALFPFINSIVAFFLLYMLVPKRRVRIAHAFAGALVASLLLELSKRWFLFYVTHVATFEHIYGALSVVPMLFFWVYLAWVVVLVGAEFVYCLGAFAPSTPTAEAQGSLRYLSLPLAVLATLHNAIEKGAPLSLKSLSRELSTLPFNLLRDMVDLLLDRQVLHLSTRGELALSRNLHAMSLYELYQIIPQPINATEKSLLFSESKSVHLAPLSLEVEACLQERMATPIAELLQHSFLKASTVD